MAAGDPGADAGGARRRLRADGGARRVPGREVRVRAEVVHGGVPAPGLPPGGPGLELPPPHRPQGRRVLHRHAGEVARRAAWRAPRHTAAIAPVAGDQGPVGCSVVTGEAGGADSGRASAIALEPGRCVQAVAAWSANKLLDGDLYVRTNNQHNQLHAF